MSTVEPIENGSYYHIYNRGINGERLFLEKEDYRRFLSLYKTYIEPIADTYAWCLMKNHFHFEIKIKEDLVYRYSQTSKYVFDNKSMKALDQSKGSEFNSLKWQTVITNETKQENKKLKTPNPSRHFSHLFSTYSMYLNAKYSRYGNLFQRPFHRKRLNSDEYLRNVLVYIHNNPVHHGFVKNLSDWQWSSFAEYISTNRTELHTDIISNWFGDISAFKSIHSNQINSASMDDYLEL